MRKNKLQLVTGLEFEAVKKEGDGDCFFFILFAQNKSKCRKTAPSSAPCRPPASASPKAPSDTAFPVLLASSSGHHL